MTSAVRRPWKRRSDARPGEIRLAALRLFAKHGFGGTTIEDVARAANVTVGTVYRYFRDKDALLADLVEVFAAGPLVAATAASSPPSEQLRDVAQRIWAASRAEPHAYLIRLLIAEGANSPELIIRYRERVLEPTERLLAEIVARAGTRDDPVIVARAVLGALLGTSVLAGPPSDAIPALVPQLASLDITIPIVIGTLTGGGSTENPPTVSAPASHLPTNPTRRPDSW